MFGFSRNFKIALLMVFAGGLSACTSTDITQNLAGKNGAAKVNTFALAGTQSRKVGVAVKPSNQNLSQKNKQAKEKKLLLAKKRKLETAKKEAARSAKRLAAHDKLISSLGEQQKALLKPQRDRLIANKKKADQEVAKLTPKKFRTFSSGGSRYNVLIAKHARVNGVPIKLAHAVVRIESSYRANARGRAGEIGLMQLKPATARLMGYRGSTGGLYDPETNIKYGMRYLGKAHKLAKGSTCGTILRYNAGHGAKRMNPISARYCKRVRRYI